jgi:hypothetical protein
MLILFLQSVGGWFGRDINDKSVDGIFSYLVLLVLPYLRKNDTLK